MKNSDVVYLVNSGVQLTTGHSLSNASAYKAFKFRKVISSVLNSVSEGEKGLLTEVGIEDASKFDERLAVLRATEKPTEEEVKELETMQAQLEKYSGLRDQLYSEEADLSSVKAMNYDDWRKLQNENKEVEVNGVKKDVFSGKVEELLEGVLWEGLEE
jgi:vacuolar-type H+-ATPase subunit I/STV1